MYTMYLSFINFPLVCSSSIKINLILCMQKISQKLTKQININFLQSMSTAELKEKHTYINQVSHGTCIRKLQCCSYSLILQKCLIINLKINLKITCTCIKPYCTSVWNRDFTILVHFLNLDSMLTLRIDFHTTAKICPTRGLARWGSPD